MANDLVPAIYWAGALFSSQELVGNQLICASLKARGYEILLPQEIEHREYDPIAIRNADIMAVMGSDVVVCNFNGTELDSGTVVEFMFAKMLGKPCVLMRSDFRAAGDGSEPWNLMVSGYPRTSKLLYNSLQLFHESSHSNSTYCNVISTKIADSIQEALRTMPLFSKEQYMMVYRHVKSSCGVDLNEPSINIFAERAVMMDEAFKPNS